MASTYGYVTPAGGFTIVGWFNRTALCNTAGEAIVSQQTQVNAAWNTDPSINGRHFWFGFAPSTAAFPSKFYLDVRSESGTLLMALGDTSGTTAYENDSTWHHFALRCAADLRTFTMFLDGYPVATGTATAAINWSPGELTFGGVYSSHLKAYGLNLYKHKFAWCAVFNTALTNNRVLEHYTAGSGGTVYYGDDEVQRLDRIFDWAKVPDTARVYDAPVTTLQGVKPEGSNALSVATDAVEASGGMLFADGQSRLVYQNRRRRYNRWTFATLAESIGAAPEVGMEFATDDSKVYNDVRADRPFGGYARFQDAASQGEHGLKVYELKLPLTSDEEHRNAAGWVIARYAKDRVRVTGVQFAAESSALIQRLAERVTIGDWIQFAELPDNAPMPELTYVVEGISVEASFKDQTWKVGLELSPAELFTVFEVGTSVLGNGDFLAY